MVVQNGPGFLVNRILYPYLNESLVLLQEGIEPQEINHALTNFGMHMGPLSLLNDIGIDTVHGNLLLLQEAYQPRIKMAEILSELHKDYKGLGKKGQEGNYQYKGKKKYVNLDLIEIIEKYQGKKRGKVNPRSRK